MSEPTLAASDLLSALAAAPNARRAAIDEVLAASIPAESDAQEAHARHARVYGALHDRSLASAVERMPRLGDEAAAALGRQLLALHRAPARPWPLMRIDTVDPEFAARTPKLMLRPQPAWGTLRVDGETLLAGIPPAAWTYALDGETLLSVAITGAKVDPAAFDKPAFIARFAELCRLAAATVALWAEADAANGP